MKKNKEQKKSLGLIIVIMGIVTIAIIAIAILGINLSNTKKELKDMTKTKDHFATSAKSYMDDNDRLNEELQTFLHFFWNDKCENRTFKGNIDVGYVPNWLGAGYQCDISRITSKKPENAHKDSRWRSLIDCYQCN